MRILSIAPYAPWPLTGGTPVRMFNLLRGLAEQGHEVDLFYGAEPGAPGLPPEVAKLFSTVATYPLATMSSRRAALRSLVSTRAYPAQRFAPRSYSPALRRVLDESRYDALLVNFLFMLPALAKAPLRGATVAYDQHESERTVWRAYLAQGRPEERLLAAANLSKLAMSRRGALACVDVGLCVSEEEAAELRRDAPKGMSVEALPNGVDVEAFAPTTAPSMHGDIVMCANMSIRRNVDAAVWFVQDILPRVRERVSGASFLLVGSDPGADVRALAREPGVVVTGRVPEVAPFYDRARVAVAPYRFGAGTKIKVLEGMAMGRPTVATPVGAAGIDLVDGRHGLIAKDPEAFASAVVACLTGGALADRLGAQARELAVEQYAWRALAARLSRILKERGNA